MLRVNAGVLAIALAVQTAAPQAAADEFSFLGPPQIRAQLELAQLRFFYQWSSFWRLSEALRQTRISLLSGPANLRNSYLHCHPEQDRGFAGVNRDAFIQSASGMYAVCPSWLLGDEEWPHEGADADAAIAPRYHTTVRAARDTLIDAFERAHGRLPADDWIIGQLVRHTIEQKDFEHSSSLIEECEATRWWCDVLGAYVIARRGNALAAESAFVAATASMPVEVRCAWTDVGVLLDSTARAGYARIPCADRDSVHRTFWWLSDPLWIERGNPRLLEHFTRRADLALRTARDYDERYDWRPGAGGDALATMIARYGWPSIAFWVHEAMDGAHSMYLYDRSTPLNTNYTTFEYSPGRIAPVPRWRAVEHPLLARHDDWTLSDPFADDSTLTRNARWWPTEHFKPARPLAQLGSGQVAMLRRGDNVLMNTAVELTSLHGERIHPTIANAVLVLSPSPDAFRTYPLRRIGTGRYYVTQSAIDTTPAVASIEFDAVSALGPPGGRARFGVVPPATLASLRPGEIAISDPVVLRAPPGNEVLPHETDAALARMATSTTVGRDGRLGVYWETYGVKPTDTVAVAVWIERYTPQGIARRLGIALNITQDLNTPVVVSWHEPQPSHRVHVISGRVPIVGRSVVLDVSALAPGDYWLDVAVSRPGHEPVRGRRSITVR